MDENLNKLYTNVNDILKNINVKKIDPNTDDYQSLKTGYYLCSFKMSVTTSKSSGNLQVKSEMSVVENGLAVNEDGDFETLTGSKNKKIWKYYPLTDEESITKLIKDMKKFEDDNGNQLLEDDDFNTLEKIELACDVIEDMQLYVYVNNYKTKNGEPGTFYNVLSWKRAEEVGLLGDEEE